MGFLREEILCLGPHLELGTLQNLYQHMVSLSPSCAWHTKLRGKCEWGEGSIGLTMNLLLEFPPEKNKKRLLFIFLLSYLENIWKTSLSLTHSICIVSPRSKN